MRILARAWIYVIWRCWQDGTAHDPAKRTALQRLLDQQRAAQAAGGPVTSAIIAALRAHAADLHPNDGQIPLCGERRILTLAEGPPVCLRYTLPGLGDRNLKFLTTAIRHAAGHPPGHR